MKLLAALFLASLALTLGTRGEPLDLLDEASLGESMFDELPVKPQEVVTETVWPPPSNPFLSQTPWWAQAHTNSFCSDSVEVKNGDCWLPARNPKAVQVQYCCLDVPVLWTFTYDYGPKGGEVLWMVSFAKVVKVDQKTFVALACFDRLTNTTCNPKTVCKPVPDTSKRACTKPRTETGDLSELEQSISASGAYSVLSVDNVLYVPSRDNTICRFSDRGTPRSRIRWSCKRVTEMDGGEKLPRYGTPLALTMLYNGLIAGVTGGNTTCADSRCYAAAFTMNQEMNLIKDITKLDREAGGTSQVVKSLSNDDENRIFIVTKKKMYAVDGDNGGIIWSEAYPNSDEKFCSIKFAGGAGSTPTSMDCGDDKLIITTGGDFPFSLVAFYREKQKFGQQLADSVPVANFSGTMPATDFQSVSVVGCEAVVVNNALKKNVINPITGDCLNPIALVSISGDPRLVTRGAAGYKWGNRGWTSLWTNNFVQSPNGIPGQCRDKEGNVFSYYVTAYGGKWTVDVLDARGNRVGFHTLGNNPQWNTMYAAVMPTDKALFYGALSGVVKVSNIDPSTK